MNQDYTLLLRLEGPMQSWGYRSRFDYRDTALEPTRSGVIGLICAAMGIARGEDISRFDLIRRMGVRVDKEGRQVAAFTPDFYLPDQDLYVEITTIKPKQVRRKNRKIRWLLEDYPEINIKLFKRSDFRQLMAKYGMDDEERASWIGLDGQRIDEDDDDL